MNDKSHASSTDESPSEPVLATAVDHGRAELRARAGELAEAARQIGERARDPATSTADLAALRERLIGALGKLESRETSGENRARLAVLDVIAQVAAEPKTNGLRLLGESPDTRWLLHTLGSEAAHQALDMALGRAALAWTRRGARATGSSESLKWQAAEAVCQRLGLAPLAPDSLRRLSNTRKPGE